MSNLMNYIFIEGLALYVLLFLIITLAVIGIVGLWSAVSRDIEREKLKDELYNERKFIILYLSPFRVLGFPLRCESHSAQADITQSNHTGALM